MKQLERVYKSLPYCIALLISIKRNYNSRLSYRRETARRSVSWDLLTCCATVQRIAFEKACNYVYLVCLPFL